MHSCAAPPFAGIRGCHIAGNTHTPLVHRLAANCSTCFFKYRPISHFFKSNNHPPMPDENLQQALTTVRHETDKMKAALAGKRLMDALKHASNYLAELRSSTLNPKQYYELYMTVFDSLEVLSSFLKDRQPNIQLADLYELVQYTGNILPRLYLMITIGATFMATPDSPVKEILKDLIEMSRGVQYPIRGLFLRYYLSQKTKNLLLNNATPDNYQDTIQFFLTNFIEMNKLWVRLQHQGLSKDKLKRIEQRKELRILVGSNLVNISQLDLDLKSYKYDILPKILEQIIQCKDVIAQEYLLDVIIQIFPDEFHLNTLDIFLNSIKSLNPSVAFKKILITLVNRLSDFAQREEVDLSKLTLEDDVEHEKETQEKVKEDVEAESKVEAVDEKITNGSKSDFNLFEKIWFYILELDEINEFTIQELNELLESVTNLSLIYYPDNYEYIAKAIKFAIDKLKELGETNDDENNFQSFLLSPITHYTDSKKFLDLLKIDHFNVLLDLQPSNTQKLISSKILSSLLQLRIRINNPENLNKILNLLKNLFSDSNDRVHDQLAKLIHLVDSKNPVTHSDLLTNLKKFLQQFKNSDVITYTYPPLFFNAIKLIRSKKIDEALQAQLFKFIQRLLNELFRANSVDLSFKLNLSSAIIADQVKLEEIAYEFYVQSFTIFEESITDSKTQFQSIVSIINGLQQSRNFSRENYENLITKTALYGSKLLRKSDQCRAVYLASHLWWGVEIPALGEEEGVSTFYRDGKRVLECLQRALRVADTAVDPNVSIELFVEILNRCLYYFIHGNNSVNVKYINGLLELIQTNIKNLELEGEEIGTEKGHFERTLDYINSQKEIDDRFHLIAW
jgi:vacuolar protein sorting-associated protein 35